MAKPYRFQKADTGLYHILDRATRRVAGWIFNVRDPLRRRHPWAIYDRANALVGSAISLHDAKDYVNTHPELQAKLRA